jgi:RNA polymerase sigma factor (sigma-70 family)
MTEVSAETSDLELLRAYEQQGSEAAFAGVVRRHINLVYSVAWRQTGNAAHAEEITQVVFVILARKAAGLRPDTILEGWLHETTRLTALRFLRGERRRQRREQEAYMQSTLPDDPEDQAWQRLAPLLDEALARLGAKDRDAVMLRYFKEKNLGEVAAALRVKEAAAQRRVHRAVEKLRRYFTQHGVALSATALPAMIAARSIQSAPAALAQSVTAVAVAKGAAAGASTLTLIQGALKVMAWNQAKLALIAGAGILLATGTTTILWHHQVWKDGWRNRFEAAYKLKDGEDLRYIATPYIAERTESFATALPAAFRINPTPPDFSVIKQSDQGALKWDSFAFGSKQHALRYILDETLGFWQYEVEAPEELLNLNLPGDWTVREGVNRETLLAALEPILFQATGRRVHFEKRTEEREVIVARGLAKRVAKIQMYAEKPDGKDGMPGTQTGNLNHILNQVGRQLDIPMVNEAQTKPPNGDSFEIELNLFPNSHYSTMGDRRAELTDLVLKNLTAQTGLTFTREQRAVDFWVATEPP